jgi:hypothetical protein
MPQPDSPGSSDSQPLPRPAPVRCAADALRVLFIAAGNPLEPETLAFMLDAHGNGGVITVVSGTTEPDSVLAVAECLARAAEGVPHAAALVLATVRPTGTVLPGDIDRWLEASELAAGTRRPTHRVVHHHASGAQCPRDLLGEPERWAPAAPCARRPSGPRVVGSAAGGRWLGLSRRPAARSRRTSSRLGVGNAPSATMCS